jgi:hypothetical protein
MDTHELVWQLPVCRSFIPLSQSVSSKALCGNPSARAKKALNLVMARNAPERCRLDAFDGDTVTVMMADELEMHLDKLQKT